MQLIGLLDCNNFFVSCERVFRPDLRRRPVVVLSGNDGCVVARSNEVKDMGVPMGVPYFQVKKQLHAADTAVFSSNFTLYRDISQRVMDTLRMLVDEVEPYSIDEAFFTLRATTEHEARTQLTTIKQTIEQYFGVPVSLGAATTKTIAKYASEKEKRGSGICVMTADVWQQITPTIPVGEVWGIGRRLTARFQRVGIFSVADLLAADRAQIASRFGVVGCRLYDELNGRVVWPVGSQSDTAQKSIMSSRSFKKALTNKAAVADAVSYHVHHATAALRKIGMRCQYVQVLALPSRHSDWALRGGRAECVFDKPTNDTRIILREANRLLDSFYDPVVPYKKAGVVLGWFTDAAVAQPDLFTASDETTPAVDALFALFDTLNRKYGSEVITVGRPLGAGVWAPARNWLSPRYTTHWPDIATVRA